MRSGEYCRTVSTARSISASLWVRTNTAVSPLRMNGAKLCRTSPISSGSTDSASIGADHRRQRRRLAQLQQEMSASGTPSVRSRLQASSAMPFQSNSATTNLTAMLSPCSTAERVGVGGAVRPAGGQFQQSHIVEHRSPASRRPRVLSGTRRAGPRFRPVTGGLKLSTLSPGGGLTLSQSPVGKNSHAIACSDSTEPNPEAAVRGLLFMYATLFAGATMILLGYQ